MGSHHFRNNAFTFVETLVAGGLVVALSSIALVWFMGTFDLWWLSTTQHEVRSTAQQLTSRVVSELQNATRAAVGSPPNISIPPPPDNNTVTFYLPADLDNNGLIIDENGNTEWDIENPIGYVYAPATGQLYRTDEGSPVILANNVIAVSFDDQGIDPSLYADEVRIRVTLQKTTPQGRTVQASSSVVVKLRN